MSIGLSNNTISLYLNTLSSSALFRNIGEDQLRLFLSSPDLAIKTFKKIVLSPLLVNLWKAWAYCYQGALI